MCIRDSTIGAFCAEYSLAVDTNLARRRLAETEQRLDERCLPCSVRPDEAHHPAACDGEVYPAKHLIVAEALGDLGDLDHRLRLMAGVESTSASGVSDGMMRSAPSSRSANALRMRISAFADLLD